MTRILLQGGCVLALGAKTANLAEGDVLVEDGKVTEVGRRLRARGAEVIDATDTIVMPGFVDTHRHAWKALLRNLGAAPGATAQTTLEYAPHYGPDDVYAATLLSLLTAVETGITTVADWSDIQVDDRYTEAALQAHAEAGLRTVFVHAPPAWEDGHDADALRRVAKGAGAVGETTTIAAGCPGPGLADLDQVASQWAAARDLGLAVHAHAGVGPSEGGEVAALAGRGLLGPDCTLVHCCHLNGADLDAVASSGAGVALAPSSEMAAGLGSPPMQQLIDRGIRPGLAVDDEALAPGDLFTQMRGVQAVQHAASFERKLSGRTGPALLSTREVIRYATVDGARAIGLGGVTGSLEPGKQADIVVLRTDRPNIFPVNDPIGAVVWGMDASNVDWVLVAGRPLLREGVLDADVGRARDVALAARQRVEEAAGDVLEASAGGAA